MLYGLSTHLFHGVRLERDHLARMADHGFTQVELFATKTHFDYHDARQVAEVRQWLDELKLTAWSVHAPICDGVTNGMWGRAYSNASRRREATDEAVRETAAAVAAAGALGARVIVLHLGIPDGQPIPPDDNNAGAVERSLGPIAAACAEANVLLALEVIPNNLATPEAVVDWLTGDLDLGRCGACLDVGHAHLTGGAPEAAETLGGHIITTHIHDNAGHSDDHLVPFDGTIDWAMTMYSLLKYDYTGPLIFELPDHGDADRTLAKAVAARARIQAILDELSAPFPFTEG